SASQGFPSSRAATLIGAPQMFGMAGGSAGQFVVGPVISAGVQWSRFWLVMGIAGIAIAAALQALLPKAEPATADAGGLGRGMRALGTGFRDPQTILCGMISGLLFLPTTVLHTSWGVPYPQE